MISAWLVEWLLKQFIFCQKRVKPWIHTFFIQFAKNRQNIDVTIIRRKLKISSFKYRITLAVLSASGNMACWNERYIHVKGCFRTSTWFCRILAGMLHGLLFLLRLFINFSISDSWTGLLKNEFTTFFLTYVLKGYFPFG